MYVSPWGGNNYSSLPVIPQSDIYVIDKYRDTKRGFHMNRIPSNANIFIPEALKSVDNWCAWKLEIVSTRHTKVPYSRTGRRASSSDRNTWSSFDTIAELLAVNTDQ